jgi:hypothetical protein
MQSTMTDTGVGPVAADETDRLIASNKVEGTTVYNRKGEHLGEVYNFMVDKYSGQVAYAVMSFGGFLGIGESYHPLPWRVLDYDTSLGGYVVDLDKEKLRGAPSFARDETRSGTGTGEPGWTTTTACRPTGAHERRSFAGLTMIGQHGGRARDSPHRLRLPGHVRSGGLSSARDSSIRAFRSLS